MDIIITDLTVPQYVFLPEAVAKYIEAKEIIVDRPEYNGELTEDEKAIVGYTLFAYLNIAHGMSEIPEASTYISVVGKDSTRDYSQSKSDKGDGQVEVTVSSPFPEHAMDVAGALYALFRLQPGFNVLLPPENGKQRGLLVKKIWPVGMEPEFRMKSDDLWTFGFGCTADYVKLD